MLQQDTEEDLQIVSRKSKRRCNNANEVKLENLKSKLPDKSFVVAVSEEGKGNNGVAGRRPIVSPKKRV